MPWTLTAPKQSFSYYKHDMCIVYAQNYNIKVLQAIVYWNHQHYWSVQDFETFELTMCLSFFNWQSFLTESLTIIYVIIRNKLVMRIFSHQQLLLVVPHHKLHIHHTGTWVSTPCSQQLGPVCMTGTEYIMLIRTTKLALSTDIFLLTPSGTIINLVMLNCR